ncbi:hypothetical protein Gpo141_00007362 [Globisporangium polare]
MTQAPAPEASISDKICTALVHTVEFLILPLKRSLQWEPSDFGEILPDWYVNAHPKQSATKASSETPTTAADAELLQRQQHVASKAA